MFALRTRPMRLHVPHLMTDAPICFIKRLLRRAQRRTVQNFWTTLQNVLSLNTVRSALYNIEAIYNSIGPRCSMSSYMAGFFLLSPLFANRQHFGLYSHLSSIHVEQKANNNVSDALYLRSGPTTETAQCHAIQYSIQVAFFKQIQNTLACFHFAATNFYTGLSGRFHYLLIFFYC